VAPFAISDVEDSPVSIGQSFLKRAAKSELAMKGLPKAT
jgi:hypothetical protein